MSDEERKIETLKKYINSQEQKMNDYYKIDEEFYKDEIEQLEFSIKLLRYILNLIEKKSKEIEHWKAGMKIVEKDKNNHIERLEKEIEELKEERKSYAEEYIYNNPWLYKQLNENYILRVESEQKERKAYIKGTNDAHELCNKKWEDETKAKIEEIDFMIKEINQGHLQKYTLGELLGAKIFLKSLLEKE